MKNLVKESVKSGMRISYFDLLINSTKFIEHLSFTKLCARYLIVTGKNSKKAGKNKREKEEKKWKKEGNSIDEQKPDLLLKLSKALDLSYGNVSQQFV